MTSRKELYTGIQCDKEGRDVHRNSVTNREGLYTGVQCDKEGRTVVWR